MRNRVLKALSGTTWGMDTEIIIATYNAIGRSLLNYAAPIWTSFWSDTQWTLQLLAALGTTSESFNTDITPTIVDLQSVSEAQRCLHQSTMTTAMDELIHRSVLNQHPPPISDNKRQLPRITGTILAQLRSGLANILNSYRARLFRGPCITANHVIKALTTWRTSLIAPQIRQTFDLWLN